MTTIYLIRHGEYESPNGVIPYRLPGFHLSEKGVEQAEARAASLADESVVAVFTSPMERTRETAGIIARPHGLVPIVDERLHEVRSPLEGKTKKEIDALGGWFVYENDWYKHGGGESISDICTRVCACIDEKIQVYVGKTIVFVTHGDNLMLAAEHYKGLPISLNTLTNQPYVPMVGGFKIEFSEAMQPQVSPIVGP